MLGLGPCTESDVRILQLGIISMLVTLQCVCGEVKKQFLVPMKWKWKVRTGNENEEREAEVKEKLKHNVRSKGKGIVKRRKMKTSKGVEEWGKHREKRSNAESQIEEKEAEETGCGKLRKAEKSKVGTWKVERIQR